MLLSGHQIDIVDSHCAICHDPEARKALQFDFADAAREQWNQRSELATGRFRHSRNPPNGEVTEHGIGDELPKLGGNQDVGAHAGWKLHSEPPIMHASGRGVRVVEGAGLENR